MVAWLIKFGTLVFKHSEFDVRFGAFVSWFVAAGFCFGFARNMFDKKTAFQTVLFISLLPLFFFVAGFFIMPDVPLLAAWAGALFFLERALLADRRLAWWGVGICFGLGMFSKYTIVLLGLAILLFILLDKPSRRWLLCSEPYVAMILAVIIFTPVIFWNANNNWASFFFQSIRRFSAGPKFSLPTLIGSALILLTPLGAIGVVQPIFNKRIWSDQTGTFETSALRKRLFSLVFTLVPLFMFALFSIKHQPKLNWTCPIWLAILPAFAKYSLPDESFTSFRRRTLWQRFSMSTLIVLACIYGG
ncbi:MAG: glycosyltransferase family 39 protein, partial [Candidatus Omnitrophica bacterium]|nr:glycosyltransferase family 39 protein [Candidatus Omnitrophota bacterium]